MSRQACQPRREAVWLTDDLRATGFTDEEFDQKHCVIDRDMQESTPILFRAAAAQSFQVNPYLQNVAVVGKGAIRLLFHRCVKGIMGVASMLQNGAGPTVGGRNEIFVSTKSPYPSCFLSAVNDQAKMKCKG